MLYCFATGNRRFRVHIIIQPLLHSCFRRTTMWLSLFDQMKSCDFLDDLIQLSGTRANSEQQQQQRQQ